MEYTEIYMQLEALLRKYSLGDLIEEPKQVTGGLMHKMYKVKTKQKMYAVKEMNPSIMKRTGVIDKMIGSERIAREFVDIIPMAAAICFDGNPLMIFNEKYYMIFDWLKGVSIFPPNITLENCRKIGMLLGKIHSANVILPGIENRSGDRMLYEWEEYLLLGQKTRTIWTTELSEVIADLKKWNHDSNEASVYLSRYNVLSHRDMDPKNVMWRDGEPCIIDWEAAGYINPHQELLEVLNYWSDNGKGEIDTDKFITLYRAYIKIVGKIQTCWDKVLAGGFCGMLGWLNYNLKRSLGIDCSTIEEKNLGTEQVLDTIRLLKQYSQRTSLLQQLLDEGYK